MTGIFPSTTTIAQSGLPRNYTLTATVSASAKRLPGPTGTVSFFDTSNSNAVLATAQLGNAVVAPALVNVSNPAMGLPRSWRETLTVTEIWIWQLD